MAGILNYKNYLNTLQALTSAESAFPSTQKTLTFDFDSAGADGWTAAINYSVIVLDSLTWNGTTPNFSNSTVIGYFPDWEGSFTEYSTGVISIPANIYQGPLLPGSDKNIPIIIVNITWTKEQETFSTNLGYIQTWEPGVVLGDPYKSLYFEPIDPIASTLDLNGTQLVIYGDVVSFTADSTIPVDLGVGNMCYFFANNGGEDILLGQSVFVDHRASFDTDTEVLSTGTWNIFAQFRGIEQYGQTTSNILELEVVPGIPLLVDYFTLEPSKSPYFPGDNIALELQVYPDPNPVYEVTGVPVENPVAIYTENRYGSDDRVLIFTGNFADGFTSTDFEITAENVDINLTNENTNWEIISYTTNDTVYTATIVVTNNLIVDATWGFQTLGKYDRGNIESTIVVGNTTTVTVAIDEFSMFVYSLQDNVVWGEPWEVNVVTILGGYSQDITLTAVKDAESVVIFQGNQSGTNVISTSTDVLGTGTWVVTASYPGDFGDGIEWANAASTSNSIEIRVRAGNELDAEFYFWSTGTDVLNVWASTSSTLTNVVSFYDNGDLVGTANWERAVLTSTYETVWYQGQNIIPAFPSISYRGTYGSFDNFYTYPSDLSGRPMAHNSAATARETVATFASPGYDTNYISSDVRFNYSISRNPDTSQGYDSFDYYIIVDQTTPTWEVMPNRLIETTFDYSLGTYGSFQLSGDPQAEVQDFGMLNPNPWRLWKYYDGTNYNLSDIGSLLDPITTGTEWTVELVGSLNQNINDLYMPIETDVRNVNRRNPVTWKQYDIYRNDDVGDYRGYNVIGIEADSLDQDLTLPMDLTFRPGTRQAWETVYDNTGNIHTLGTGTTLTYYNGVDRTYIATFWRPTIDVNGNYIDFSENTITDVDREITLVEYIGQIEWPMPVRTNDEVENPPANKIIKLYKFTPEVRQTNTGFKTRRPLVDSLELLPPNVLDENGWYVEIPVTIQGIYRDLTGTFRVTGYNNQGLDHKDNRIYGRKKWDSRNIYLESENEYTHFCNLWYTSFARYSWDQRGPEYPAWLSIGRASDAHAIISTKTITTQTETSFSNVQLARLELPLASISTITNLTAEWQGTLGLPAENGRFGPFTISPILNPGEVNLELFNISPAASYNGDPVETIVYTTATNVYSTNPVVLKATIITPDELKYPLGVGTGQIDFYSNGVLLATKATTTGTASIIVDASTLTNAVSSTVILRSDFTNQLGDTNSSSNLTPQAINYSFNMVPFDYQDPEGSTLTARFYANERVAYKYAEKIAEFSKASLGYATGDVYLHGNVNVLLPFNNRSDRYYSYKDYNSGRWEPVYGSSSPMVVEIIYSIDGVNRYLYDTLTDLRPSHETQPTSRTITLSRKINNVLFQDSWTTLEIFINVLGYRTGVDSSYMNAMSGLFDQYSSGGVWFAPIPLDCKFGYTQTISVSNS